MRRRSLLLAGLALAALSACRTGGTPPGAEAPPQAAPLLGPTSGAVAPLANPVPAPAVVSQPVALVSGFGWRGPEQCVPLKASADVACIPRSDPVQLACTKLKGDILRCDDCRPLCSKPLEAKRRAR